ncbi:LPS O-antigen chain length determinant protein WzzB [Pseudomonas frederiksbergensis]|uniref:LPS O-antigen chain length determinant protein WzzB n=1 Tax=Pseudomonas frederiksbergensis TaxID=104087 RepID=UPI000F4A9BBB|nr:Wzz/FepE/Etk N-terminal domain-containing protein [Pseudomonas frederiksbergensis]RON50702.1 chain-length determining protein [Pseudomonas frederiksbergensis]
MTNDPSTVRGSEEIDLFELVKFLWDQKVMILSLALIVVMGAATYAFLSKPVYEARVFLQPPTLNGIADFNYGRTKEAELVPYSIKDVYEVFTRNLQSESLRRTFFLDVYLPSLPESDRNGSQDALYEKYLKTLTIGLPSKEQPDRYSVAVQDEDPARATEWVRTFSTRAGAAAEKEMITNVTREAGVRARNIGQQISILRETESKVRSDSISRLGEALRIAQSIGLEDPPIIAGNVAAEVSATMDGQLTYMRGSKALSAEIKNLLERKSDDPFIENLRALQIRKSFFEDLQIDPASVSVFRQDGTIDVPDQPIKPKKAMIIGLGIIGGAALGVLIGLFRYVWHRRLLLARAV